MRKHISVFAFLLCAFAAVGTAGAAANKLYLPANVYLETSPMPIGSLVKYVRYQDDWQKDLSSGERECSVSLSNGLKVVKWEYATSQTSAAWTDLGQSGTNITWAYRSDMSNVYLRPWLEWLHYSLSYTANGGSGSMTGESDVRYDTKVSLPSCGFTKTGYSFAGWSLAKTGGTVWSEGTKCDGHDFGVDAQNHDYGKDAKGTPVTLYAQWTPNQYTVTFDANCTGGSCDPASTTATYDSTYGELPKPTRPGKEGRTQDQSWRFDSWYDSSSNKVESTTKVVLTNDVSLYAHWTEKFEVKYVDAAQFGGTLLKTEYVVSGGTATPPANPAHTGYTFTEWTGWNGFSDVKQDRTYTAVCTGNGYTIVFHSSLVPDQTRSQDFTYGESKALSPNTFVNAGFGFLGWAEAAGSRTVKYGDGASVTDLATGGEVHLYAVWDANAYRIVFDGNGGSGDMDPIDMLYGMSTNLPLNAFVFDELEFKSWRDDLNGTNYLDGATVSNLTTVAGGTVTLKAIWHEGYFVEFNPGGGTGEMPRQAFNCGVELPLPANRFTRTGYTFDHWTNTQGKVFKDSALVKDLAPQGATASLYAVWTPNMYTIRFDDNGANWGTMAIQTNTYDKADPLLPNQYGGNFKTFLGWARTPDATAKEYDDKESVLNLTTEPNGTVVLYAVWQSTLGDLSRAAGCDNLNIEGGIGEVTPPSGVEYGPWITAEGACKANGVPSAMSAKFTCGGVVKFRAKVQSSAKLRVYLNEVTTAVWSSASTSGMWVDGEVKIDEGDSIAWVATASDECWVTDVIWDPNGETLRFDANGGTGAPEDLEIPLGGRDKLPREVPTKGGSVFAGWEFKGETYQPRGDYKAGKEVVTNVMSAVWAAAGKIAVPVAVTGLVYDGTEKTGVATGTGYSIVGNVATNAGEYTATATPLAGCVWEDGFAGPTNIAWTIAKATVDMSGVSFTNATYVANGKPHSLAISGALPSGVTNVTYVGNGQTEVGDYTVTAKFAVDGNHEAVADMTAKLKLVEDPGPGPGPGPGPEPTPVVTNAVPTAIADLVYDGTAKTGVVAGANYTIIGNVATNAGDYTAVATVTNGVWEGGATGATNILWTIAKGTYDMSGVTFASATYEWDGKEHSIAVAGAPSGVEVVYTGDATNRTEVGTNTVTASFKVLDELNYNAITTQMVATLAITSREDPPPPDPTVAYENIYFKATLAELGAEAVPTNRKITIKAEGLPKGLKLVTTTLKDGKNKATGYYAYTVEGAPTETMDGLSRIAYVRVTDNKVQTLYALDLSVLWAKAYEDKSFPDGEVKSEYANFSVTNLWPDVAAHPKNWTFSGWPTGIKFTTKAVTSRKKIDGVYVTLTNALAYEIYGTPTKAGRFTVKAVEKIDGTSYKSTHVATFTVWPQGAVGEAWTNQAYVAVVRESGTNVTAASGLPTGIKFTAKDVVSKSVVTAKAHTFYGTPTKADTYVVTLTHEDKSKTQFLWTITPAEAPAFELKLTETEVNPETAKATIRQGVSYDWAIDCTSNATVTASGLPTGLKLVKTAVKSGTKAIGYDYSVAGVPTKAGEFFVTFTTKLNGVSTVTTAAFTVQDLPAWAQGTFNGGADESFATGGQATLTVSNVGKLSGKWMAQGTNWTLSAASYDHYDSESGSYVALMIGKAGSGKNAVAFTNELFVSEADAEYLGGVATNALFIVYQNVWKTEPWKTIGMKFTKGGTVLLHPGVVGTNDTITLKFAASGAVTVAGKFEKSVDAKNKVSYYSVSTSAVLCPQGDPDGSDAFDGVVFVYFPPKAKTPLPDGYSACVWVHWDGSAFAELPPESDE